MTLLERGGELAWACSSGNAGLICPSHATPLANRAALLDGLRWMWKPDSPLYLRPRPGVLPWIARFTRAAASPARVQAATRTIRELSSASLGLHEQLSLSGLETGLVRRGSMNVYAGAAAFAGARAEADENRRSGLRVEVLEGAAAREVEPALAEGLAGAVFYPDDAHCDPHGFVRAVGAAAVEAGATVRTRVEAIGLRRSNGRVAAVQTTSGELPAGEIVLAAGAWTPGLARQLGVFAADRGGQGLPHRSRGRPGRSGSSGLVARDARHRNAAAGTPPARRHARAGRARPERQPACAWGRSGRPARNSWRESRDAECSRSGAGCARARPTGCRSSAVPTPWRTSSSRAGTACSG